jgi:hypothetical protein
MTDNRFSSGTPNTGDERFDYFATPEPGSGSTFSGGPATATSPAGGRPGSPAGGRPGSPPTAGGQFDGGPAPSQPFGSFPGGLGNQFGAAPAPTGVATEPADPFGTPTYATAATASGRRTTRLVVIVLAALLLLGAGLYGLRVYEHNRPVVMPISLGGLPASSNAAVMQSVTRAQEQLQQQNPNMKLQVRAYGADATRILIAGALRGRTNVTSDLASFGNNIGATQQVGSSICATSPASHVTVCERSSGDLTVIAASVTRAPAADMPSVAALVDVIWQQN